MAFVDMSTKSCVPRPVSLLHSRRFNSSAKRNERACKLLKHVHMQRVYINVLTPGRRFGACGVDPRRARSAELHASGGRHTMEAAEAVGRPHAFVYLVHGAPCPYTLMCLRLVSLAKRSHVCEGIHTHWSRASHKCSTDMLMFACTCMC
jgi:hypothetical protein